VSTSHFEDQLAEEMDQGFMAANERVRSPAGPRVDKLFVFFNTELNDLAHLLERVEKINVEHIIAEGAIGVLDGMQVAEV
jgi:hypothetical protein